ncbi:MAG: motility protein A [Spirochaetaceae bacterium]|nr:motility protein A [Spirochaetaceae bacterium]
MDLGTIGGIALCFLMLLGSVLFAGSALGLYIDAASIILVIGGSLAGVIASSPLQQVLKIVTHLKIACTIINYEKEKLISTLVSFSEQARREGLLALEDSLDELEDKFLAKGLRLVVDGTDPTLIKSILYNELNQLDARHQVVIKMWSDWTKLAPAFGMMGTVLGLIAMMANLGDQASVGSGMALALITTLYGAFMGNAFCAPIQAKLETRNGDEIMVKELMVEGILSIQSGDNPRMVEEKLLAFLSPIERESIKAASTTGE